MHIDPAAEHPNASIWLPLLRPHLPEAWSRRLDTGRERQVLDRLSGQGLTALECALQVRPDETSPRFDISQRVDQAEQALALVAGLPPSGASRTLSRWADAPSVRQAIPSIWLEFDFDRPAPDGSLPTPLLCLRVAERVEADALLDQAVPRLLDTAPTTRQRRTLGELLDALPSTARPLYIFDLSPRRAGSLRLELIGLDADQARRYVNAALPTEIARRTASLLPWIEDCDRPHLSFDVHTDGSIDDRVGLEISFAKLPHNEPRWGQLFDRLVDAGLCAEPARDALFAWPGQDRRATAGDAWPSAPSLAKGHLARVLSHAKLVTAAERPLEAKGYVLFQYVEPRRSS